MKDILIICYKPISLFLLFIIFRFHIYSSKAHIATAIDTLVVVILDSSNNTVPSRSCFFFLIYFYLFVLRFSFSLRRGSS